jgi:hypothetical protein
VESYFAYFIGLHLYVLKANHSTYFVVWSQTLFFLVFCNFTISNKRGEGTRGFNLEVAALNVIKDLLAVFENIGRS